MAKIAVISDIHGNLTALEAVKKDIRKRRITRIISLGDIIGRGPQPAECVDLIREICEVSLLGNWEHKINLPADNEAVRWQQERLGAERLQYLEELPFSFDLQMSGKWLRFLHASPQSVYHRVNRSASKKEKRQMFEHTEKTWLSLKPYADKNIDAVGYGDIHVPYVQMLKNKDKQGLLLFNTGSVGAPYDGIAQASYVILEGKPDSSLPSAFSVAMVRVPYDVEKLIQIAEQMNLPNLERFCLEMRSGLEQ
ncbi:metallophosphoesterase family protein [Paenibacillus agricola]|uniref:Metallophosphoesterase family protein n=1 Tax=Paenibacillus agricola TaxID=2716264 RepID=A0ABX0JCA3_9BACL|nr:metallophosphoesterase family protein [Paenibacillus agricola]NHN31305.1 metallophosphoesterase family protein [Paenibacillus agricola]